MNPIQKNMDYLIFTESSFFQSINNSNGTYDLRSLYTEFSGMVFHYCTMYSNHSELLLTLIYTEIELQTLYEYHLSHDADGRAEYLHKAIILVHRVLKMLKSQMCPQTSASLSLKGKEQKSPLYWQGSLVNLMELIASLDYSGMVADINGKPQSFASLVFTFESIFNVSISKPYDLRADLSRRKKNLSVLLPILREVYEKNIVNCGMGK